MNVLVLGHDAKQLEEWRDRSFTQGTIHRLASGQVQDGSNRYFLFVARPNDERVLGMEFQRIVRLSDVRDFGVQYQLRIRP